MLIIVGRGPPNLRHGMRKSLAIADTAIVCVLVTERNQVCLLLSEEAKLADLEDSIALAAYHRGTAIVFWESAKMLNDTFEAHGQPLVGNRMAIPFYHLISHAAELLLKCALLKRSVPPDDLKKYNLRHSLGELLKAMQGKGVPISDQAEQMIAGLDRQHKDHSLRYSFLMEGDAPIFTPPPQELFALLEELLMAGRISTHGV